LHLLPGFSSFSCFFYSFLRFLFVERRNDIKKLHAGEHVANSVFSGAVLVCLDVGRRNFRSFFDSHGCRERRAILMHRAAVTKLYHGRQKARDLKEGDLEEKPAID
jgi:hypothetical protein